MFAPDKALYPDYDENLEGSMIAETIGFFGEMMRKNGSLREFLDSDWTMLNERLAEHYGISGIRGDALQRVALKPGNHRGGLLTHGSILSLTSDGTRHRPVHRGVWVMESIFGKSPPPPPANSWLDVKKPEVSPEDVARLTRRLSMAEAGEYYRLFYDLMVLALRTDSTRVITCMIGSESQASGIPEIGISQTRHGLSHHNGDPEQLRRLTETDTFLIEQFGYFLDQLKSQQEDGTPLLDTTQVLWGSGMAYGHSHGNANLPTLLAGGRALGYKHGQHIDFNLPTIGAYNTADAGGHYKICSRPVDADARVSNLLLTMVQRADVKAERFQDSLGVLKQILA